MKSKGIISMADYNKKELGDYQTPPFFTEIVCDYLKNHLKISPDAIIEPTCGIGNFLKTASEFFPNTPLYGIDIDSDKLSQVDGTIAGLTLINEDIFSFKFDGFDKTSSFLILGNPPWVTNTELSKMDSGNLPEKVNFKNELAIDAMTGESNFDISEAIILRMIEEFKNTPSTIAFLCKTTVARNIFTEMQRSNIAYSFVRQLNFNASKVFRIDAEACLFIIRFGGKPLKKEICEVADLSNPNRTLYRYGFKSRLFYSNLDNIPDIDGQCQFEWRQGVKHDCANVMELTLTDNKLTNKAGKNVNIEDSLIYPLLKTSQLKEPVIKQTSNCILITQKKVRQDTSYIRNEVPKTWKYLNDNREFFDKRKSSIYINKPDFSIFGIGDYSFKKYKVAVSGFYKNPMFCLVYAKKPMMLDDTCYFLSFDSFNDAYITMLILNTPLVKRFLKNIAFLDSKRPYTKKVLKRIDLVKCLNLLSLDDLKNAEKSLGLNSYITRERLTDYTSRL